MRITLTLLLLTLTASAQIIIPTDNIPSALLINTNFLAVQIQPRETNTVPIMPDSDFILSILRADSTILLTPGTYLTGGDTKWRPKSGQCIQGAGMFLTTIQLTNLTDCIVNSKDQTNITLCDLTLDCNHLSYDGVLFHGSGNRILRVRLINRSNFTPNVYREGFGLLIAPTPFPVAISNEISDCIISNYTANGNNNDSAISISGDGSIVQRNTVYGNGTNYTIGEVFGLGVIGNNPLVESNNLFGCFYSYHSDTTGGTSGLTFDANQCWGAFDCFFLANSTNQNMRIFNNVPMQFLSVGIKVEIPCAVTNCTITGNLPLPTGSSKNFMDLHGVSGLTLGDNSTTTNVFTDCVLNKQAISIINQR